MIIYFIKVYQTRSTQIYDLLNDTKDVHQGDRGNKNGVHYTISKSFISPVLWATTQKPAILGKV